MSRLVFRFAPSPNGELHLGHALSAILNFEAARETGGRFLLRIEDIDATRCRPDFEAGIFRDLSWLGLEWEEPVRRQSEHFSDYAAALERLKEMGLVYPSFLTRRELGLRVKAAEAAGRTWPRDPDGAPLAPLDERDFDPAEAERLMAAGEPFAWRLHMDKALAAAGRRLSWIEEGTGPDGETGRVAARPEAWGDVVLARKETPTSYHLAVVVDDALQGVMHVVRGQDLFHATSVHRLLQDLLGLPAPAYRHHRLILGPDGKKLSKSTRSTSLRALAKAGVTPAEVREMVCVA